MLHASETGGTTSAQPASSPKESIMKCAWATAFLVLTPSLAFAQASPLGLYRYGGDSSTFSGFGAYKYGYGDYSDRYGYRPMAPGNANTNPAFPLLHYNFPPSVQSEKKLDPYPVTTFGGYQPTTVGSVLFGQNSPYPGSSGQRSLSLGDPSWMQPSR